MVSHLKEAHRITENSRALAIAKESLRSSGRKFWACGFCVTVFSSFSDRIKHLAKQHFEAGMMIDAWDTSKVIKGLLLQPIVDQAWEVEMGDQHGVPRPEMSWHASNTGRVQTQLEMGASSGYEGYSLAKAAYEASQIGSGISNQSDLMSPFQSQHLPAHNPMLNPMPPRMQTDVVYAPSMNQHGLGSTQTASNSAHNHSTAFQDPWPPSSGGSGFNLPHTRYSGFSSSTSGQTTTHEPQGFDGRAHLTEHSFQEREEFDDIVRWGG